MPYGSGSEKEIEQRQKAARKHGAYAFLGRGEAALEPVQRSRLQELREQVQTKDGIVEILQDRAANAVMMVEVVTSYIASQIEAGKTLEKIDVLGKLPAFMNSAQRSLKDLIEHLPEQNETYSAELDHIKQVIDEHSFKED
jgi:hypothetical protein